MAFELSAANGATVSRIFSKYAGAAVNNGVDIMSAAWTPPKRAGVVRVTVCVTTTSKLYLTVTDGTTAYTDCSYNNDTLLTAKALYVFEHPISATTLGYGEDTAGTALSYNFQLGTTSVIRLFWLDYVTGPVI